MVSGIPLLSFGPEDCRPVTAGQLDVFFIKKYKIHPFPSLLLTFRRTFPNRGQNTENKSLIIEKASVVGKC